MRASLVARQYHEVVVIGEQAKAMSYGRMKGMVLTVADYVQALDALKIAVIRD